MEKRLNSMNKKAFSVAEVTVVMIIMMGILLLVGKIALGDRQKEYDAKFNKISSAISANITKDLVENTGSEYADYAITANGNDYFQSAVKNNLNSKDCSAANCWGATSVTPNDKTTYDDFSNTSKWALYELNDKTVMSVSKERTAGKYKNDVLVDVNGKKGPNVLGKDIQIYNYPYKSCNHMGQKPSEYNYAGYDVYDFTQDLDTCKWERECKKGTKNGSYIAEYETFIQQGTMHLAKNPPDLTCDCQYIYKCIVDSTNTSHKDKGDKFVIETPPSEDYLKNCNFEYTCDYPARRNPVSNGSTVSCPCKEEYNDDPSNEYAYYEQKDDCDWELKKKCNKPHVLTADKKDCECPKYNYPANDGTIVGWSGENEETCMKTGPQCNAPKEPAGSGKDGDPYRCICNYKEPANDGTIVGWSGEDETTCMKTGPLCNSPKKLAGTGTETDKYRCECDDSAQNPSNENIYYEKSDDCEWVPVKECKAPLKINPENKKGDCICAITEDEGKNEEKASNVKFKENKEEASPSNMCKNIYTYSCGADKDYTAETDKGNLLYDTNTVKLESSVRNTNEAVISNLGLGTSTFTVSTGSCAYTHTLKCKNPNYVFKGIIVNAHSEINGYICECPSGTLESPNGTCCLGLPDSILRKDNHVDISVNNYCEYIVKCPSDGNRKGIVTSSWSTTGVTNNKITIIKRNAADTGNSSIAINIDKTKPISLTCPCQNARVSDTYIDTNSVYTGSPKSPTRDPETCEWTYYCKNTNLTLEGTGTSTSDKLRCECGEDNIINKNNSTFNQAKEDLYNANKGKMSNGKTITIKPTSSNKCTRTYGYTYKCKVLTDNETYNAIPEEIRNNACGIGTNGLNSSNCSTQTSKKYKITFNNTYDSKSDSCAYKYTKDDEPNPGPNPTPNPNPNPEPNPGPNPGPNPICNEYYKKDKYYDSATVTPVQNPTTCEWEYPCKDGYDMSYTERLGTGNTNTVADRYHCDCKTGTQNPSYDKDGLRAFYGDNFDNYVKETRNSKGNKADSCNYVYECKTGTNNKSYSSSLRGLNTSTTSFGTTITTKKVNEDPKPKDNKDENGNLYKPCQYIYSCLTKETDPVNTTYRTNAHKYFDNNNLAFNEYVNEHLSPIDAEKNKCTYLYSCKHGTENISFNNLSEEIKNNTCFNNDPATDDEKCNSEAGKKQKYAVRITAATSSNTKQCIYNPICNSNYAAKPADIDTATVRKNPAPVRNNDPYYTDNKSTIEKHRIVVDKGACDYTYTYKCERYNGSAYVTDENRQIQWNEKTNRYECPCANTTPPDNIPNKWVHNNGNSQDCSWRCVNSYTGLEFSTDDKNRILLGGQLFHNKPFYADYVKTTKSTKNAWSYKNDTSAETKDKIIDDRLACDFKYTLQCKTSTANASYDSDKATNKNVNKDQNSITIEDTSFYDGDEACRYIYSCKTEEDNSTYNKDYMNDPDVEVEYPTLDNGCEYTYTPKNCEVVRIVTVEGAALDKNRATNLEEYARKGRVGKHLSKITRSKDGKTCYVNTDFYCQSRVTSGFPSQGCYAAASPYNNCIRYCYFPPNSEPMILDLKGDGIKLTDTRHGVKFDLDADGKLDWTSWTEEQKEFDDAFLALDRNKNGKIDNGKELFGDQNGAANGYEELAKSDSNNDGKIDENDPIYHELYLWADMNKNGITDSGELKTLKEMDVFEIPLGYDILTGEDGNTLNDEHGNDVGIQGTFKRFVKEIIDGVETVVEYIGKAIDAFFNFFSGEGE